jgi:hypothetical protein
MDSIIMGTMIWGGPLVDGSWAFVLVNSGAFSADINVRWTDMRIDDPKAACAVRDLWKRQNLGTFVGGYTAKSVASGASVMLKVKPL